MSELEKMMEDVRNQMRQLLLMSRHDKLMFRQAMISLWMMNRMMDTYHTAQKAKQNIASRAKKRSK